LDQKGKLYHLNLSIRIKSLKNFEQCKAVFCIFKFEVLENFLDSLSGQLSRAAQLRIRQPIRSKPATCTVHAQAPSDRAQVRQLTVTGRRACVQTARRGAHAKVDRVEVLPMPRVPHRLGSGHVQCCQPTFLEPSRSCPGPDRACRPDCVFRSRRFDCDHRRRPTVPTVLNYCYSAHHAASSLGLIPCSSSAQGRYFHSPSRSPLCSAVRCSGRYHQRLPPRTAEPCSSCAPMPNHLDEDHSECSASYRLRLQPPRAPPRRRQALVIFRPRHHRHEDRADVLLLSDPTTGHHRASAAPSPPVLHRALCR
jgi:hypothetical protein